MSAALARPPSRAANVAHFLAEAARTRPEDAALVVARSGESFSFSDLDAWSDRLAHGLVARGVKPGMRALLLVRPGGPFAAIAFALMKVGAIPVFVDPGLARRHLFACIEQASPAVLVAIRPVVALRWIVHKPFRSVRHVFTDRPFFGAISLSELEVDGGAFPIADVRPDDPAIVAFTSGSTGTPKGVVLTQRVAHAQIELLRDHFGVDASSRQLALLPMLALLGPGLGCASVLPDVDTTKPAQADPAKVIEAIVEHRVTHAFGSPAIWAKVASHCLEHGVTLASVKVLLIGGAPVPPRILHDFSQILTTGQAVSPLGATEAVMITSAAGPDIVRAAIVDQRGRGTLVGRPVPGAELRLVRITDEAIAHDQPSLDVADGEPGELIVRGPMVTPAYDQRPEANRLSKIPSPSGVWHRMGDLARRDAEGRYWFLGRKSERIETAAGLLFTACLEPLVEHPDVARVAVVGIGERPRQRAFLVAEPRSIAALAWPPTRRRIVRELLEQCHANPVTRPIEGVLLRRRLPLDLRHAAKLLRGEIAAWVEARIS